MTDYKITGNGSKSAALVFLQWREFVDQANPLPSETHSAAQEKRLQGLLPFFLHLEAKSVTCFCCAFRICDFMSQKVPLKSHVTKYGMYSKYKPTRKKSINRLIVTLKLYRKEASMKEALLWFVRCLERWKEKRHKTVSNICLISDAEPQGSHQGKEKLDWRRDRVQVPLDGDRDGQVEEKH